VTREAAHTRLAPERRLVDVVDHLDHLPRDRLLRLDVELTFVGVRVVAIAAAYAERRFEQDHRRIEHVRPLAFERLDVLENLLGLLIAALGHHRRWLNPAARMNPVTAAVIAIDRVDMRRTSASFWKRMDGAYTDSARGAEVFA
jgi:hypothetical protein